MGAISYAPKFTNSSKIILVILFALFISSSVLVFTSLDTKDYFKIWSFILGISSALIVSIIFAPAYCKIKHNLVYFLILLFLLLYSTLYLYTLFSNKYDHNNSDAWSLDNYIGSASLVLFFTLLFNKILICSWSHQKKSRVSYTAGLVGIFLIYIYGIILSLLTKIFD